MNYDLDASFIATIRDDIPSLKDPEEIREVCLDDDATNPDESAEFSVAQRTNDRITLRWYEGSEEDEQYDARMEPENPFEDNDNDYWQWSGEVVAKYIDYSGGLQADRTQAVRETGEISGLLFEQFRGAVFVGTISWENGERERVVIELIEVDDQ